jgi:hypothetical protein
MVVLDHNSSLAMGAEREGTKNCQRRKWVTTHHHYHHYHHYLQ